MVHRDGLMRPELTLRRTRQESALGPLKATVYPRQKLADARKAQWTDALCTSALRYNCGIWPRLKAADYHYASSAYVGSFRAAAGKAREAGPGRRPMSAEILMRVNRPDLVTLLRFRRLRYYSRLARRGSPSCASFWITCSRGRTIGATFCVKTLLGCIGSPMLASPLPVLLPTGRLWLRGTPKGSHVSLLVLSTTMGDGGDQL